MQRDWDARGSELASAAIAAGEPTAWFDRLYSEGEHGDVSMPWDRNEPNPRLREWVEATGLEGGGRTAVVVGCGLGADAEYLAGRGFATTAFDVAPTAVRLAAERHPGSAVRYRVADLLRLPAEWQHAYDLVVEIFTVQALPDPPRPAAVRAVSSLLAPGGTLLAIAFRRTEATQPDSGPPFPLTRAQMEQFAVDGVRLVRTEELEGPTWRVELQR